MPTKHDFWLAICFNVLVVSQWTNAKWILRLKNSLTDFFLIHCLIYLFIDWLIDLCIYWLIYLFIYSCLIFVFMFIGLLCRVGCRRTSADPMLTFLCQSECERWRCRKGSDCQVWLKAWSNLVCGVGRLWSQLCPLVWRCPATKQPVNNSSFAFAWRTALHNTIIRLVYIYIHERSTKSLLFFFYYIFFSFLFFFKVLKLWFFLMIFYLFCCCFVKFIHS